MARGSGSLGRRLLLGFLRCWLEGLVGDAVGSSLKLVLGGFLELLELFLDSLLYVEFDVLRARRVTLPMLNQDYNLQ